MTTFVSDSSDLTISTAIAAEWSSFHIYYHENRFRLLAEMIVPTVRDLLARSWIDRFFFIIYPLGGPHVRLRVRSLPGWKEKVYDVVHSNVEAFFYAAPSQQAVPAEEIRRINRGILAGDSLESDDSVYPDNCCFDAPFVPETARYGGKEYISLTLDFFAISSAEALRFYQQYQTSIASRRLGVAARLLVRQARAFACNLSELVTLLDYALGFGRDFHRAARQRAREVYTLSPETYQRLILAEITPPHSQSENINVERDAELPVAAGLLACALDSSDVVVRHGVLVSQMHMTANRLGLGTAEEVYLGELLSNAAKDLKECDVAGKARLQLSRRSCVVLTDASRELRELTNRVMSQLPCSLQPEAKPAPFMRGSETK